MSHGKGRCSRGYTDLDVAVCGWGRKAHFDGEEDVGVCGRHHKLQGATAGAEPNKEGKGARSTVYSTSEMS